MGLPLYAREYVIILIFIIFAAVSFVYFFKDRIFYKWAAVSGLIIFYAYFLRSFWLFVLLVFLSLIFVLNHKPKIIKLGFYLMLLPLLPAEFSYRIPFLGADQLFSLTYPRIISLIILLPIFLHYILHRSKTVFMYKLDKYVILCLVLMVILITRNFTVTGVIRFGLNKFIDFFLPYFTISRSVEDIDDFEGLFKPMVFTAFIFVFISAFECIKHWHLYEGIIYVSEFPIYLPYIFRSGFLRSSGPFLIPLVFGAYFCIMSSLVVYLRYFSFKNAKFYVDLIILSFFAGAFFTFSHGPISGFFLFFFIFYIIAIRKTFKSLFIMLSLASLLMVLFSFGFSLSDLPLFGERIEGSINYRQALLNNSWQVIQKYPLLGNNTAFLEPEIQELAQYGGRLTAGQVQGIDIVNSYLGIALDQGLVGLGIFLLMLMSIFLNLSGIAFFTKDYKTKILGKVLFSVFLVFCFLIFNISLSSYMPYYFWILVGLSSAYIYIGRIKYTPIAGKIILPQP